MNPFRVMIGLSFAVRPNPHLARHLHHLPGARKSPHGKTRSIALNLGLSTALIRRWGAVGAVGHAASKEAFMRSVLWLSLAGFAAAAALAGASPSVAADFYGYGP